MTSTTAKMCWICGRPIKMQCFLGTGVCCELCRKNRYEMMGANRVDVEGVVLPLKHFRKKPVIFEAVQLRWDTLNDVCAFVGDAISPRTPAWNITPHEAHDTCGEPGPNYIAFTVTTASGVPATVRHGDWIVPDEKPGTFMQVAPDVFKELYQEVNKHGEPFPPYTIPTQKPSSEGLK
jgi:hypothetical protein